MSDKSLLFSYIDDIARASGNYALCESIKQGYQICFEGFQKLDGQYHEQSFLPVKQSAGDFEQRINQFIDYLCEHDGFTRQQKNNDDLLITNGIVNIEIVRTRYNQLRPLTASTPANPQEDVARYDLLITGVDPELDKMIKAGVFKHVSPLYDYYDGRDFYCLYKSRFTEVRRGFLLALEYGAKVKMPKTIDELRALIGNLNKIPSNMPTMRSLCKMWHSKCPGTGTSDSDCSFRQHEFAGFVVYMLNTDPIMYADVHEFNLDYFAKMLIAGPDHDDTEGVALVNDFNRYNKGRRLSDRELAKRNGTV